MVTAHALLSIEQYLRTSYSPDADFVEGVIQERNLGEFEHGRLQGLLSAFFINNEAELEITTVVEQRIRVSPGSVRICDIALLRTDAPRERVTETPPFLCIEILSPEDRLSRAKVVLNEYFQMGVQHLWLIDPQRRVSYIFDANGLHEQQGPLTIAGTRIQVDIDLLFARLD